MSTSILHLAARRRAGIDPATTTGWAWLYDGRTLAASGLADGASLAKWTDTSGHGRDQTGTAVYRTGGWADFYKPGTNTGMNNSIGGSPLDQSQGWSMYWRVKVENLNAAQSNPAGFCDVFIAQAPAVNGFTLWLEKFQSNTPGTTNANVEFDQAAALVGPALVLPFSAGYFTTISLIATPPAQGAGAINLYVDGVLAASATNWHLTPSDNLSGFGVGIGNSADASTRQLQAKVAFMGAAQRADSAATRAGIESFLGSQWR